MAGIPAGNQVSKQALIVGRILALPGHPSTPFTSEKPAGPAQRHPPALARSAAVSRASQAPPVRLARSASTVDMEGLGGGSAATALHHRSNRLPRPNRRCRTRNRWRLQGPRLLRKDSLLVTFDGVPSAHTIVLFCLSMERKMDRARSYRSCTVRS